LKGLIASTATENNRGRGCPGAAAPRQKSREVKGCSLRGDIEHSREILKTLKGKGQQKERKDIGPPVDQEGGKESFN